MDALTYLDQVMRKNFESSRRILSFEEYLQLIREQPNLQLRGAAQYFVDMMDFYGKTVEATIPGAASDKKIYRFKLFDFPIEGITPKAVGQEEVQTQIYNTLKTFTRQGMNNKLILLHGPNGSAKTTLIHGLMGGLERYSREGDGALYTFNWIFPVDKVTKGSLGLHSYAASSEKLDSFARLPDEEVVSRIPCEMKDHPILLIAPDKRQETLSKFFGEKKAAEIWDRLPVYLREGDLCHRCKQIMDSLLLANAGNYKKVMMHVQVERFYFSGRYRKGLVTIEPQMHVDAHYNQLTYNKSLATLPPSLQGLNLFSLSGDLVDGNRGVVEYSDLLKRPIDTFKYLLTACEKGAVNVGSSIAYLDTVLVGSSNDLQLDAFKEFPDFSSFKARIELVRVPYLLSYQVEEEIYRQLLPQIATEKHIAPHVPWTLALWAVLTRLKKPNSINYPPNISSLISNLTPIEKARLYDSGEMPVSLQPEDRKLLRASIPRLREEYTNIPYYEGRMGASAREIKSILYDAVGNPNFACVSPLAVLTEMENFVKRVSEYEFLKQDVKDGFHDAADFINTVRSEYLDRIDREVRDSIGLYDSKQWEDFLRKYVQHISHYLKREKIHNPVTGKTEDPDLSLISEFEKIVQAPKEGPELDTFRTTMLSQVGAWSLDHPGQPVVYGRVFPDFWKRLEKHYYETQKALLTKMHDALQVHGTDDYDPHSEGSRLAQQTVENMKKQLGYCDACAKEVITFLMKKRY
ncbi:MAG: serine protein kinase PrkA [Bacteriovoracia bacterium]